MPQRSYKRCFTRSRWAEHFYNEPFKVSVSRYRIQGALRGTNQRDEVLNAFRISDAMQTAFRKQKPIANYRLSVVALDVLE